jgi:hypothetical protein
MILYTDFFVPPHADGITLLNLTLIRPKHRDDMGLHIHEAVHREQFAKDRLFPFKYLFSKKKRLQYEVEAYHAQYCYLPLPRLLNLFAEYLVEDYRASISLANAKEAIIRGTL